MTTWLLFLFWLGGCSGELSDYALGECPRCRPCPTVALAELTSPTPLVEKHVEKVIVIKPAPPPPAVMTPLAEVTPAASTHEELRELKQAVSDLSTAVEETKSIVVPQVAPTATPTEKK